MTLTEIFWICALKGAVITVLYKFGFWPDWEQRAIDREEKEALWRAYKEWRDTRPESAPAPPLNIRPSTQRVKERRAREKQAHEEFLARSASARENRKSRT